MRVCHVVYGYFPFDPRVRREVETLARHGHEIDVIAMREEGEVSEENVLGVRVHRVPLPVVRGGKTRYLFQYTAFLVATTFLLFRFHIRRAFDVIHVHSLPDFQVFAAAPERLTGAKVVLDLHEAMPEILAARFRLPTTSAFVRLARAIERLSCSFANSVLVVNGTIRDLLASRGVDPAKLTIVMNSPDPEKLVREDPEALREKLGLGGKVPIVYVGGINRERDLGLLVRACAILRAHHAVRLVVYGYGDPDYLDSLRKTAEAAGLGGDFVLGPRLPAERVFSYVSLSEVGPITYERSPLTEIAIPNKVFEYAAAGKPLVIANLGALRKVFSDAALFYDPGDAQDLAEKMRRLLEDPLLRLHLAERAARVLDECRWDVMTARLVRVYDGFRRSRG